MAISFTKYPTDIVFSGNPVIVNIKDTDAIGSNVDCRSVIYCRFIQGFSSLTYFDISYNSTIYEFQFDRDFPYKSPSQTIEQWLETVVAAMRRNTILDSLFHIRRVDNQILFVEKNILGDIVISGRVYYIAPNLDNYISLQRILKLSKKITYNNFHAIGIQPKEVINLSLRVAMQDVNDFSIDYGEAIEILSSVYYTSEDFIEKISDGSLYVETDIKSLLKFDQRGHFNIEDITKVYDLAKQFTVQAYALSGVPPVKTIGDECPIFYVINAEITRTRQAALNDLSKTLWAHLITTRSPMSWAPDNKIIDIYFPELVYCPIVDNYTELQYWVKEYFSDGTNARHKVADISAVKYQIVMLNASFLKIRSESGKVVTKYEVWIQRHNALYVMYPRTYILSYKYEPYARWWIFKNGFGVYEVLRTTGKAQSSEVIDKTFIEIATPNDYSLSDRDKKQVSATRQPIMKVASGPLNEIWAKYYLELFDSEDVYLLQKGKAIPANIKADEFVYKTDGENLSPHEFTAELMGIDEDRTDLTFMIPIDGDYLIGDFNESFFIGTI